jgi:hypothetical protein
MRDNRLMARLAWKGSMTKHFMTISVCLGTLVLLTGCHRPVESASAPQGIGSVHPGEARDHLPARQESLPPEQITGLARTEGPAGSVEQSQVAAGEDMEAPRVGLTDTGEPNQAEALGAALSETPPLPVPTEPNTPTPREPNGPATTAVEPNAPDAGRGQTDALPAFCRACAELLQDHVYEDGSVDYGSLHRRRLEIRQILMELDGLDSNAYAAWPPEEKLAFWINAYNLKMIEIITRNYPIESSWWLRLTWPPSDIRHITGIWTDYKFLVMDEEFTLAEVERRFFHREFNDPRAYLAITYASRSGPPLRRTLYTGAELDRQLHDQVKTFLAGPQGLVIDRQEKVVRLSAIFKPAWRGKEFVARYGTDKKFKERDPQTRAVLNFITNYLSREDAYFLETENYRLEYMNYDWRLNDTSRDY